MISVLKGNAMSQKRAKVGGEFGANGEWYEGGKFINTVPENAKKHGSQPKSKGPRKEQIDAYSPWEYPPAEGMVSLFPRLAGTVAKLNRQTGKLDYIGAVGGWENHRVEQVLNYVGVSEKHAKHLIDLWNNGQRWIARNEFYV